MTDERISPTPNSPRRRLHATEFAETPGANHPAYGLTPPTPPVSGPRWRSPDEAFSRLVTGLVTAFVLLASLAVAAVLCAAVAGIPGLVALAVLVVPALLRTARLVAMPDDPAAREGFGFLVYALLASFRDTALAFLPALVTFGVVRVAVVIGSRGLKLATFDIGLLAAGAAGLSVFLAVFVSLWPRRRVCYRPPSPDLEN